MKSKFPDFSTKNPIIIQIMFTLYKDDLQKKKLVATYFKVLILPEFTLNIFFIFIRFLKKLI
jgi:hypothetical protein